MLKELKDTLLNLLKANIGRHDIGQDILSQNVLDQVEINFDMPKRDWPPSGKPLVNLYLYDIREKRELRETWREIDRTKPNGTVTLKPQTVWMELSYMVTCWANTSDDQDRLLWSVLKTLCANSPLPVDTLQGELKTLERPIRTEVAQPEGVLKNVSEFWTALENNIRPAINLVVTLGLDVDHDLASRVAPQALVIDTKLWIDRPELAPLEEAFTTGDFGLIGNHVLIIPVHGSDHKPVTNAKVTLTDPREENPLPAIPLPGAPGSYVLALRRPGSYQLIVEVNGRPAIQQSVAIPPRSGGPLAPRVQVQEVPIAVS
jgi:hypothetical protein